MQKLIQILNSPTEALSNQVKAWIKLRRLGHSEAWWAICRYCYHHQTQIADMSRLAIQKLDGMVITKVLADLLETKKGINSGAPIFQVLSEIRLQSVLKFIVESIDEILNKSDRCRTLANWFKETQFYYKAIPLLIQLSISQRCEGRQRSPSEAALSLIKVLIKIDDQFAFYLARYATQENLPTINRVITLGLLEGAPLDNTVIRELLPALKDPDEYVRSKAAKICGNLVAPMKIFKQILADPDPRVRANAVESLWFALPSLRKEILLERTLVEFLNDSSSRVRANVARIFHEMGRSIGMKTLKNMKNSQDPRMQASATWMIKEIGETKTNGKTKTSRNSSLLVTTVKTDS